MDLDTIISLEDDVRPAIADARATDSIESDEIFMDAGYDIVVDPGAVKVNNYEPEDEDFDDDDAIKHLIDEGLDPFYEHVSSDVYAGLFDDVEDEYEDE